jgi:hypothetical protein
VEIWNHHNKWWCKVTRDRINFGWCYQFAILLKKLHGDEAKLFHDQSHVWVKIGNRYYDSDHPHGVIGQKTLSDLNFCEYTEEVTEEEVAKFWRTGGSGEVDYGVIEEVIKLYKEQS